MKSQAERSIKEIIADHPRVAEILETYGIGCGPCSVGICKLKDILEIHALPEKAAAELMQRIEAEISGGCRVAIPAASPGEPAGTVRHDPPYSEAMQILVDEHALIKRWLGCIPDLVEWIDLTRREDRQIAATGIDFIRSYADRLHHGKEEAILFEEVDDGSEIFQVFCQDHTVGRRYVADMVDALSAHRTRKFCGALEAYRKLLEDHIDREDRVLFPWLDRRMDDGQKAELLGRFQLADIEQDIDVEHFRDFLENLEERARHRQISGRLSSPPLEEGLLHSL